MTEEGPINQAEVLVMPLERLIKQVLDDTGKALTRVFEMSEQRPEMGQRTLQEAFEAASEESLRSLYSELLEHAIRDYPEGNPQRTEFEALKGSAQTLNAEALKYAINGCIFNSQLRFLLKKDADMGQEPPQDSPPETASDEDGMTGHFGPPPPTEEERRIHDELRIGFELYASRTKWP